MRGIKKLYGIAILLTIIIWMPAHLYAAGGNIDAELPSNDGTDAFQVKDNSTPDKKVLLHVNSSGEVGIGTINPTDKLHVEEGYLKVRIFPPDDVTEGLARFSLEARELGGTLHTWKLHTAPVGGGYGVPGNGIGWWEYNDPDGDGNLCETGELCAGARLFLQANTGNVGIGLTNPSRNLEIYKSGAESSIQISGDIAQQQALYFTDGTARFAWYKPASTNALRLWSAGITGDLITFAGSGNVGIGTTSPSSLLTLSGGDIDIKGGRGLFLSDPGNTNSWGLGTDASLNLVIGMGGVGHKLRLSSGGTLDVFGYLHTQMSGGTSFWIQTPATDT